MEVLVTLIGLNSILDLNPDSEIIAIMNFPIQRRFKNYLHNCLEGIVVHPMYEKSLFTQFLERSIFRKRKKLDETVGFAEENKKITLISSS
jgi:hypothetical protein